LRETLSILALVLVCTLGFSSLAVGASVDPARLVLRQSDVPAPYQLNSQKSGVRTLAEDTREFPELRAKYRTWGHQVAYQVQFDHIDDNITSRVDLLRNRTGARGMLEWFVREANRQSQLHIRPRDFRLGDDGMLYWWKFDQEEFTIVLWRSGRVFSIVGGGGIAKRAVIALARKQQQRVRAAVS
jgi:hypothetical protein